MPEPFWKTKKLHEMTGAEWESVCDGCGKCCLQQLQDEQTEQLVFTDVACDLLDAGTCRCRDYPNRSVMVPECLSLNNENVEACAEFTPSTCAYRLLLQGDDLPAWHHLVSGDREMVHNTGNSVRGRIRMQRHVDSERLEDYVVDWL
ncbi:MAG: YcgN family cysteine cluster protein [Gammaproteobacteria bacterium]|nr:YcgN family cysteine cluster protein [Gammaproteobacteria bacterium]